MKGQSVKFCSVVDCHLNITRFGLLDHSHNGFHPLYIAIGGGNLRYAFLQMAESQDNRINGGPVEVSFKYIL